LSFPSIEYSEIKEFINISDLDSPAEKFPGTLGCNKYYPMNVFGTH
jgi:hypothetical protein